MPYKQAKQKLSEIFWCKSCLNMSTRPRIFFDKNKICNACIWSVEKKEINWNKRKNDFLKIVKRFKSNKDYDCIVPVSGGKDGSFICYTLKHKFNLNPLAVTVRPPLELELGKNNLINFINSGYDHIHISPNRHVMRALDRIGFEKQGFAYFGWLTSIYTSVLNLASKMNINLIVYAEDGEIEFGGTRNLERKKIFSFEHQKKVILEGGYDDYMKILKKKFKNLNLFLYPNQKNLKKIRATFFSYYTPWDPYKNYLIAKKECGLAENENTNQGTFTNFAQNDQKLYLLHMYLMYLKFGFGRATQDAGIEIRRGAMTRSQALNLVKLYDGLFPDEYLSDYLEYYQMNKIQFFKILKKFTNKNIFSYKNFKFYPKFKII